MIDEIRNRRSIRTYTNQEVSKEDIEDLLRSAMQAPCAKNMQEWRFYVIRDRETLNKLSELPNYTRLQEASLAIIIMADTSLNQVEYCLLDCGAAAENILLEVTKKGLGACWCALVPREVKMKAVKEMFNLPDNILPMATIAIGYPNEKKEFVDRYDANKVTWI